MKSALKKIILIFLASTLYSTNQPLMAMSRPDATNQQVDLKKIQDYLNGIRTLQANFQQTNPNGTMSAGKMYVKRLGTESFGKLRLDYTMPTPTKIIADGEILRHIDGETKEVSEYAIDNTPASFLLRHKIDFSRDLEVKAMDVKNGKISLTVQRSGEEGVTLTLIFATSPLLRLQEWVVMDAQANQTHVVLNQVQIGVPLEDKLFTF